MAVSAFYDNVLTVNTDRRNPGHGFVNSVISASAKVPTNTVSYGTRVNTVVADSGTDARLTQLGLNTAVDKRVTITQA